MLGALAGTGACEARTSVEGAQTAVAVAQTSLPGIQTVIPNVQATAQIGATLVSGLLADPQAINIQVKALLAGSTIEIATTPANAPNERVSTVEVKATDTQGTFGQIDGRGRQAALIASLLLLGQYYPDASIAVRVLDANGTALIQGSKLPGEQPSLATGPQ